MKNLSSILLEKLRINKDIKVSQDAGMPENKEQFIDFIERYYREWWESDTPASIKASEKNEKNYENSYNYIMKQIDGQDKLNSAEIDSLFIGILPVKFIQYMNQKYNLGYALR